MSPRRAAKIDIKQPQIVEELRALCFTVHSTASLGKGFPDIVVGKFGINILVEIKNDNKGKLTEDERNFHDNWLGQVAVCYDTDSVINEFIDTYFFVTNQNWYNNLDWLINVRDSLKENQL